MHGYFIDMRLYRKAKSAIEPFSLIKDKQRKVKDKIEEERKGRVQIHEVHFHLIVQVKKFNAMQTKILFCSVFLQKLPSVNRELALKLMSEAQTVSEAVTHGKKVKASKVVSSSLLKDPRFKKLFENPEFQIDKNQDEFRYHIYYFVTQCQ